MKAERSLRSRALQLLAQRDQSRLELRRKLLRHARGAAAAAAERDDTDADAQAPAVAEHVEAVLDWLEANTFLSNERFIESRVHIREGRFGNRRIRAELAQHGLAMTPEIESRLADSELTRAATVRARRFDTAPRDATERAAQSRFLAARGFSPELIHRLMRELQAATRAEGSGVAA